MNADGYITTGQGILSYNMYAYCLNNPVHRVDYTGNSSSSLKWWSSTMWWLCGADSVLPFGEALYVGGMLVLGAAALCTTSTTTVSIPKTTPPPAGMPAVVTTIGALNSTGKVIAIQDGPTHVSVIPAPHMGTLQNWIDTCSTHPCTEAVRYN